MPLVCESAKKQDIYKCKGMCTNVKFNDRNAIGIMHKVFN